MTVYIISVKIDLGDKMKKVLILMCVCLLCFGCGQNNSDVKDNNTEQSVGDVNDLFDNNITNK